MTSQLPTPSGPTIRADFERLPADLISAANLFPAATLHEAGGRIGVMPSAIKPVAPSFRICGPAVMLVKLVGSDRIVFGTENPGSGTALNPETGRSFDDIRALVEDIDNLTAEDRANIYENNARALFSRLKAKGGAPALNGDANKYLTGATARQGIGM